MRRLPAPGVKPGMALERPLNDATQNVVLICAENWRQPGTKLPAIFIHGRRVLAMEQVESIQSVWGSHGAALHGSPAKLNELTNT
jgi:hypothetical protein